MLSARASERYVWFARIGLHATVRVFSLFSSRWCIPWIASHFRVQAVSGRIVNCDWVRRCILHFRAFDLYLILFSRWDCRLQMQYMMVLSTRLWSSLFSPPILFSILFSLELFCLWAVFFFLFCFLSRFFLSLSFSMCIEYTQVCNAVFVRTQEVQPLCACPSR